MPRPHDLLRAEWDASPPLDDHYEPPLEQVQSVITPILPPAPACVPIQPQLSQPQQQQQTEPQLQLQPQPQPPQIQQQLPPPQEHISNRYLPAQPSNLQQQSEPQVESKPGIPTYVPGVPATKRILPFSLEITAVDRRTGSASQKEMNSILDDPKIRHLSLSGAHLLPEGKRKLDYAAIQAANTVNYFTCVVSNKFTGAARRLVC